MNFRMAVSWLYHSEDEDIIFEKTGWDSNSEQYLYATQVVDLLHMLDANPDEVHDWSES